MSNATTSRIMAEVRQSERMSRKGNDVESLDSKEPLTRNEVYQLRHLLRWNLASDRHGRHITYFTNDQSKTLCQMADTINEDAAALEKASGISVAEILTGVAAEASKDLKKTQVERLKSILDRTAAEADQADHDTRTETKGRKFYLSDEIHNRLWQYSRQQQGTASEIVSGILDRNLPRYKVTTESETAASPPPVAEAVARIDPEDTPHLLVLTFSTGYVSHVVLHAPQGENPEDMVDEAINELTAEDATTLTQIEVFRIEQLRSVYTYIAPKHDYLATEDQASS